MDINWDCIIVGGGAAGLSAALVLGRARRRTLVIDAGRPSNAPAPGIGGLLGHDGRPPSDFYAAGRAELAKYSTVEVLSGEVVEGSRHEGGFVLTLADGSRRSARTAILATGMAYRYPDLPGIAERWGRSVFHCPFCHGWEVRDQRLGVLDGSAEGVRRALLLTAWSGDVTLFTDGPSHLDAEEAATLARAGVRVDEHQVAGLDGDGDALAEIRFSDGTAHPLDALLVPVTLHQRSALAVQLGAALAAPTPLAADAVDVDALAQTAVPGLNAAGDVSGSMPSVAVAVAAGSTAAAAIVRRLVVEAAA